MEVWHSQLKLQKPCLASKAPSQHICLYWDGKSVRQMSDSAGRSMLKTPSPRVLTRRQTWKVLEDTDQNQLWKTVHSWRTSWIKEKCVSHHSRPMICDPYSLGGKTHCRAAPSPHQLSVVKGGAMRGLCAVVLFWARSPRGLPAHSTSTQRLNSKPEMESERNSIRVIPPPPPPRDAPRLMGAGFG